jgi:tetratricopeptide (TPR) repeat protein
VNLRTTSLLASVILLGIAALGGGCDYRSTRPTGTKGGAGTSTAQKQYRADVLQSALAMLNAPERFDDEEKVSQQIVEQLNQWIRMVRETQAAKNAAASAAAPSPAAPSPTADEETISVDWQQDPLVETLPARLRRSRAVRLLPDESFDVTLDGQFLREAALLRDIAHSIEPKDKKYDDLSVASAIFDWTIGNVQPELPPIDESQVTPTDAALAIQLPHETLFTGRGLSLNRAWAFMLIARQQGLNTVLVATPNPDNPDQPRPWAIGVVIGDDIHLFDFNYGLPIPGPGGEGVATLAQAAEDDAILRQMDIPGDRIYPRKASELKNTIVLVEGSPGYLSRRMKLLESYLTGRDRLVLTTDASQLAERVKALPHVGEVRLWTLPYQTLHERQRLTALLQDVPSAEQQRAKITLQAAEALRRAFAIPVAPEVKRSRDRDDAQRSEEEMQNSGEEVQPGRPKSQEEIRRRQRNVFALRIGRLLHLRGIYGGASANAALAAAATEDVSEIVERGAKYYYSRAMPPKQELDELNRMLRDGFQWSPGRPLTAEVVLATQQMRDSAVYWLGMIWFDRGGYEMAVEFLGQMTLQSGPENIWTNNARFNLARCYEELGKLPEAIALYEADRSPQRYGNRLRAERLKRQLAADRETGERGED